MQVECTGRQVAITDSLRVLAEEGIARIAKILGRVTGAHLTLTAERHRRIAEIKVKTKDCNLLAVGEATNPESALRDSLAKVEAQAVRYRHRMRTRKRQPKEEKQPETLRKQSSRSVAEAPAEEEAPASPARRRAKAAVPVTVHSFPARAPITEPHIVRSPDSVALRPMTVEEAVKEAEFRDRDVFVFRDHGGNVKVLHRKRNGEMELIEAP